MNYEAVKRAAKLLNERERHETQLEGFQHFRGWLVGAEFEVKGERPTVNPNGPREAYRMKFSLNRDETGLLMHALEEIYKARIAPLNEKIAAEGVEMESADVVLS